LPLADSLERGRAHKLLKRLAIFIRQVCQFHRLEYAVNNQRRSKAGTQTEKKHAAAAVAPERLHRSIVDNLHQLSESFFKVKSQPTFAKIRWVAERLSMDDRGGIANRNHIVFPVAGLCFNSLDQFFWRHRWSGFNLQRFPAAG